MFRVYSKRLLSPYVGMVQVAELGWARALSLDGKNWAIRYAHHETEQTRNVSLSHDPRVNLSLILTIEEDRLKTRVMRSALDPDQVRLDSQRLFEALSNLTVPFKAADRYEYWLLDSTDKKPLALLHSCVDEDDMKRPVPFPEWLPIPAAELAVPDPDPPNQEIYQPPVNYRLQKFIEECAGNKPQAVWFERTEPATIDFPPCLIRDKWEDPESQRLCEFYLQRLAPRLLMMHSLPHAVRQRLEQAASDYIFEIEKFYPLYPEVVDDSLLTAARVEARLRRANEV